MATSFVGGEAGGGNSKDKQKFSDSNVYTRKSFKGLKTGIPQEDLQDLPSHFELNSMRERGIDKFEAVSGDSFSLKQNHLGSKRNSDFGDIQTMNGISESDFPENRALVSLSYKTKKERRELRRKLEGELSLVRGLVKKLERHGNNSRPLGDEDLNNSMGKLKRVHSEVGSVGWHEGRPVDPLRVTVPEHSQGASDNVEKDKRTPKANQFYQSADFILGKEKIPNSEQNKKSKLMGKKNGETASGIGMGSQSSKVFKSCTLLLDKLMKHKHGWVFNTPVDVKALGLHDYFTIIKHPMDLGTVKTRLNTNWYKSPKEFAEDVRLTFQNAMKYNPKGHDVHVMAETLLNMFEKWASIEVEFAQDLRGPSDHEVSLLTPTSKKTSLPAPPPPPPLPPQPPVDVIKKLDRAESMTNPVVEKPVVPPKSTRGRKPVPKKPKAKDPNKRDMTYKEKQKLSTELQNLPSEKLDNVVQIIRKRNPSLCQNDDEIEVDIDSVDKETLWELDRFVIYYKKNISKIKKAQFAGDEPTLEKEHAPLAVEEAKENQIVEEDAHMSSLAHQQNQDGNATKSHSSGSSSSDSGSSSSGSDSDSSSA